MNIKRWAVGACLLVLSGCGGGGSAPPSGSVSPAPSPAPAPTPTPAPVSYHLAGDYDHDFDVASSIGFLLVEFEPEYELGNPTLPNQFVAGLMLDDNGSARLTYTVNPETIAFAYGPSSISFTGNDRDDPSPYRDYARADTQAASTNYDLFVGLGGNDDAIYVMNVTWRTRQPTQEGAAGFRNTFYQGFVGTPSDPRDPLPDVLNYEGIGHLYGGTPQSPISAPNPKRSSFSITPSPSNVITGYIPFVVVENGGETQLGNLMATGQFDRATNKVSGTINDPQTGLSGIFRGQLFGPQRAEIALVLRVHRDSDQATYVGYYVGRR